jgi:7-carboxy-7-deazaguanine synthase
VARTWPDRTVGRPRVVCTGGEPLLQLDVDAINALHDQGFYVAVEWSLSIQTHKVLGIP